MSSAEVIVVGAGLAGLACALRLREGGVETLVLEASDMVGGRMRTDEVSGIRVDRGYQVINPAYPALRRVTDVDALDPQPFDAGVVAVKGGRRFRLADPRRLPGAALESALAPIGTPLEKAAFVRWALAAATGPGRAIRDSDGTSDVTLAQALDAAHVGGGLRRGVIEPFLAGVLADSSGQSSAAFARLVIRSLVKGTPFLPATGAGALPLRLATLLPAGSVRLGAPVTALHAPLTGIGVLTPDGELSARAVVVATDASSAASLLPGLEIPHWRPLTTFWHLAPALPAHPSHARLVHVDADRSGPLANSAIVSAVAPSYLPSGSEGALVASTAVSADTDADLERAATAQLARIYGVDTRAWELVSTSVVPHALPACLPPLQARRPVALGGFVYVAGDHRDTPTQQGALTSGRRAADAVLADLRAP